MSAYSIETMTAPASDPANRARQTRIVDLLPIRVMTARILASSLV